MGIQVALPGRGLARGTMDRSRRLFWLVPLIAVVVMALAGGFIVVRDLSSRTRFQLDQELLRRSLDSEAIFRDRELLLLDSVRLASNLQGMAEAVQKKDGPAVRQLLGSVLAVQTSLNLVVVTDGTGSGLVEFARTEAGKAPSAATSGGDWRRAPFVDEALAGVKDRLGDKRTGFVAVGNLTMFATAGPIRSAKNAIVGVAIAGVRVDKLAKDAAAIAKGTITLYDIAGGVVFPPPGAQRRNLPQGITGKKAVRRSSRVTGQTIATLYTPLTIRDTPAGTLAVSMSESAALSAVRGTAVRLAVILFFAIVTVMGVLIQSYRNLEHRVDERTQDLGIANRNLEESNQKLEEIYRAQSEFFSQLSHELRTPLFVITGNAELILDPALGSVPRKELKKIVASIKNAGDYVSDLVNEILDFKRLEAGRMKTEIRKVDLGEILEDATASARSLAQLAGLEFLTDLPPSLPAVNADSSHVKKILNNLVSNAVKYTASGGTVRLSASVSDGSVELSVTDTGVGIPRAVGQKIFEPFYRVESNAPQRGEASSGLGLTVTRQLVETQGGRIWYRSSPGKGSTFTFTLPLREPGAIAGNGQPAPKTKARPASRV